MNEEIKEILRNCEKTINDASGYNDTTDKILDYITNLQQYYNDNVNKYEDLIIKYSNLQEEKEDYKSRNEKAIPMLKELNKKLKDILNIGIDIAEITDIENILTGGDKE